MRVLLVERRTRNQSPGRAPILLVARAEARAHELFFSSNLEGKTGMDQRQADKTPHLAPLHGRAENRQKQAGINGVSHPPVRAGADQFVPDLHGYGAAPVAAKVEARPDGKQQSGSRDSDSQPRDPRRRRQDRPAKPRAPNRVGKEQVETCNHEQGIGEARSEAFPPLGGLGPNRPQHPDNKESGPKISANQVCLSQGVKLPLLEPGTSSCSIGFLRLRSHGISTT